VPAHADQLGHLAEAAVRLRLEELPLEAGVDEALEALEALRGSEDRATSRP
jgi:hypothetical protein